MYRTKCNFQRKIIAKLQTLFYVPLAKLVSRDDKKVNRIFSVRQRTNDWYHKDQDNL